MVAAHSHRPRSVSFEGSCDGCHPRRSSGYACTLAIITPSAYDLLKGVADANAARSSIARDYMKKCDCIWVLAPIQRAVDNQSAKNLLGDAFRMQLMSEYPLW